MYRGFNLNFTLEPDKHLQAKGKGLFFNQRQKVKENLNNFLLPNKSLNGTNIQENWFPEIDAHIFLSHSHQDEETALILSGWLFEHFKLKTFIDSTVWGYANDLLRIIDNEYCRNGETTYSYGKRNYSTSHVHLMLVTALNKMIDNCECVFFLNTPNSISSNIKNERTSSPWIYTEIAITQTIQKKTPERIDLSTKTFSKGEKLNENLRMEYELELSHMKDLEFETLLELGAHKFDTPLDALDELYDQVPINNKFFK